MVGDGEQRRDFVHVKDVARANILAAEFIPPQCIITDNTEYNLWKWGEIFNIGSGENYSINEIADMVGGEKTYIPPREGEARHTLANTTKANTILGWNPTLHVRDWINSKRA